MIGMPEITLGILAGGRATRLGGSDKAWLRARRRAAGAAHARGVSPPKSSAILVSANRDLRTLCRRTACTRSPTASPDVGPLGGLDALAAACNTPWLLTIPVDLVGVNECLLPTLGRVGGRQRRVRAGRRRPAAAGRAVARRAAARARSRRRSTAGELAVQALQARLDMACVRFAGVRFGNLNTPADLRPPAFARHDSRHDRIPDRTAVRRGARHRRATSPPRIARRRNARAVARARPRAGAGRGRADGVAAVRQQRDGRLRPAASRSGWRRRDRVAAGRRTVRRPRRRPGRVGRANASASPPARRCRRARIRS